MRFRVENRTQGSTGQAHLFRNRKPKESQAREASTPNGGAAPAEKIALNTVTPHLRLQKLARRFMKRLSGVALLSIRNEVSVYKKCWVVYFPNPNRGSPGHIRGLELVARDS